MSEWKLLVVLILYTWQAYEDLQGHRLGFSLTFAAYAVSIIGLILANRGI